MARLANSMGSSGKGRRNSPIKRRVQTQLKSGAAKPSASALVVLAVGKGQKEWGNERDARPGCNASNSWETGWKEQPK